MDAFEGIHSVQISSSPPSSAKVSPGYEVLRAGRSGIAVYSSAVFYGSSEVLGRQGSRQKSNRDAEAEGCVVGR